MGSTVVDELDSLLASLNQLKPPGASKGKITAITQLCTSNIQLETNIVQSLYRALKKAPATHKLGAIYVVDSVVRKWIEQAKGAGQSLKVEGRGEPGTTPAAVKRITELMPALFDDILKNIPAEQKEKLESMVKIWEKGNTFPSKMLDEFKAKLSGVTKPAAGESKGVGVAAPVPTRMPTPPGLPPQWLYDQGFIKKQAGKPKSNGTVVNDDRPSQLPPAQNQQAPSAPPPAPAVPGPPPQDVNSILAALKNAVPQPTPPRPAAQPAAPQPTAQPPASSGFDIGALMARQNGAQAMPMPPSQPPAPNFSAPQAPPPFQLPPGFPPPPFQGFPPQPPPSIPQSYPQALPPPPQPQAAPPPELPPSLLAMLPANIINDRERLIPALKLLLDLQNNNIPQSQWAPVLEAMAKQDPPPAPAAYGTYDSYGRGRGRSRSPEREALRRGSPVYGSYDELAAHRNNDDDYNHRGRNRYRDRSPMRNSPMPAQASSSFAFNGKPMQPKYITYDNTLPPDNIKVLSRTIFVGGANGTESEIRSLFEGFGQVQTCIANRDKRHAFVKMTTRRDALAAKAGVERLQAANDREVMNVARQTKWGVGFGPRESCDFAKGESVFPIHRLTEADRKWLLSAEFGGTGGKQIEPGMVLEEPDIEIGQGVSSKAMSKRVMPDGGPPGKRHREDGGQRGGGGGGGKDRDRNKRHPDNNYGGYSGVSGGAAPPPAQYEVYGYRSQEPVSVATPPAVPGFGFSLPGVPPGQTGGYR